MADYLAAEAGGEVCHEDAAGPGYAMAGGTRDLNPMFGDLFGQSCPRLKAALRLPMSDIKVHLSLADEAVSYYPDLVVTCDPQDTDKHFVRHPGWIVEVLPPTTERVDRRVRFFAHIPIESPAEYVPGLQADRAVTVPRRNSSWRAETVIGLRAAVALESVQARRPLAATDEGV